ncbi:MAG: hypothetical protein OXH12_04990 [Chloroflexi bacterium]|nr:hypothetical protein [Chloroflexota bacterium]
MAILDIVNRTENWKTACYFAPLFGHGSVKVARRLLAQEKERAELHPGDVRLELFWYGMRDYFHPRKAMPEADPETLAEFYFDLFPDLRTQIKDFKGSGESKDLAFQELQGQNYDVSSRDRRKRLAQNLLNTEVDIVLESPTHLFVGEAKHLSTFGASGRDILTHQLIRQHVMAKILLKLPGNKEKAVVPFVVGDDRDYLQKTLQVQFVVDQGWMRKENILTWSDIEALW